MKRRATAVTINEQYALGDKKECRYWRTDDIAEVDIGELECTEKTGISPGPTKKCRFRRTVDIGHFYRKIDLSKREYADGFFFTKDIGCCVI